MPKKIIFLLFTLCTISSSWAGVIVGGTRVIYPGQKKEVLLNIKNPEKINYLVQSWVEYPDNTTRKTPFVVNPPLVRLEENKDYDIRLIRNEVALPEDRESWFWLNIKAIPGAAHVKQNQLQVTVRTRIKIFYRPEAVKEDKEVPAYTKVIYQLKNNQFVLKNPTPFFINVYDLVVNENRIADADMIAPFGEAILLA